MIRRCQSEVADDLTRSGWMHYQPTNSQGWRFFFRRNLENDHYYFGSGFGYDYLTLFKNGRIAEGIIETGHQRRIRKKREILFRDFRWLKF